MKSLKHIFSYALISLSLLIVLSTTSYAQQQRAERYLVPVGGGTIKNELFLKVLSLSKIENPKVLIIPYAATSKKLDASTQKNVKIFRDMGVENLRVLELSSTQKALQAIEDADIIWMPGGGQGRLIKALGQAEVVEAIQLKYEKGTVIGGTSAGASIMSDVMMLNSKRDEETKVLIPTLSYGLKLWPEVIIDQHFSERNRLERLEIAVKRHPNLVGIGLDEGTGVIYEGENIFSVVGEGTVTVLNAINPWANNVELEKTILREGDRYDIEKKSLF